MVLRVPRGSVTSSMGPWTWFLPLRIPDRQPKPRKRPLRSLRRRRLQRRPKYPILLLRRRPLRLRRRRRLPRRPHRQQVPRRRSLRLLRRRHPQRRPSWKNPLMPLRGRARLLACSISALEVMSSMRRSTSGSRHFRGRGPPGVAARGSLRISGPRIPPGTAAARGSRRMIFAEMKAWRSRSMSRRVAGHAVVWATATGTATGNAFATVAGSAGMLRRGPLRLRRRRLCRGGRTGSRCRGRGRCAC